MKIVNGLITELKCAKIKIDLIPKTNENARPGTKIKPTSFTIHNPYLMKANVLTEYADREKDDKKSWHFSIGPGIVYQELPIGKYPDCEEAWHAGTYKGNHTSISAEVQEDLASTDTAERFAAELCEYMGWDPSKAVVTHKSWSGKICPAWIFKNVGWSTFMKKVKAYYDKKEPIKPVDRAPVTYVVVSERLVCYDNPNKKADIIKVYKKGDKLKVYDIEKGWAELDYDWYVESNGLKKV